jgi:hypothetical protein
MIVVTSQEIRNCPASSRFWQSGAAAALLIFCAVAPIGAAEVDDAAQFDGFGMRIDELLRSQDTPSDNE